MEDYRVAILAAGAGSRLGAKAANCHKTLIRVGEKAVISHIVDLFPSRVTFVVGVGHNSHLIKEYLDTVHPDRTFIFENSEYGPGYGPGYSIGKCKQHLRVPFFYFDCDTIITNFQIDQDENWVACAEIAAEESFKYCTVLINTETDHVTGFVNKTASAATLAWTGAAFVKNHAQFWEALESKSSIVQGELQIAPALFSLSNTRAKRVTWFDVGNDAGLALAQERFQTVGNLGRIDEEIYFHGGSVIKYYEDTTRLKNISSRMTSLKNVMPTVVKAGNNFIKYEYTSGTDLSRVTRLDKHILSLLEYCGNHLWARIELPESNIPLFKTRCLRFYRSKTISRVKAAFVKLSIVDSEISLNGTRLPALGEILQHHIDWNLMSDGLASRFHGDLNLSNVILRPNGEFTLVDCREDFAGELNCGDRYYDLAKTYQSFLLPHESIRTKAYEVIRTTLPDMGVTIHIPEDVAMARRLFDDWALASGYNLHKIQLISAMTLVNSAVLHEFSLTEHMLFYGWFCLYNLICKKPLP